MIVSRELAERRLYSVWTTCRRTQCKRFIFLLSVHTGLWENDSIFFIYIYIAKCEVLVSAMCPSQAHRSKAAHHASALILYSKVVTLCTIRINIKHFYTFCTQSALACSVWS